MDASGWSGRAHFAAGPTGEGWRCAPVGEEHGGAAMGGVLAVCATLATLVVCGSALDQWRKREVVTVVTMN